MLERQHVIEKAIRIENLLSILVTQKFFPGTSINGRFLQQVMYDPHANTAFKVSVFSKCYPEFPHEDVEKIRRMFSIRNIYAHCGLELTSAVDPGKSGIIDPKKLNEPLDFVALEAEFMRIEAEISEKLGQLIASTGVEIHPRDTVAPESPPDLSHS